MSFMWNNFFSGLKFSIILFSKLFTLNILIILLCTLRFEKLFLEKRVRYNFLLIYFVLNKTIAYNN